MHNEDAGTAQAPDVRASIENEAQQSSRVERKADDALQMYKLINPVVHAVRVTEKNMQAVEDWCEGSIKGMALLPSQRCIDIQTSTGEQSAYVGHWVIKPRPFATDFTVLMDDAFRVLYMPA